MEESVPSFLAKVARYRPRIVCFVGMGIWRIVEKVIVKTASLGEHSPQVQGRSPSKGKSKKSNTSSVGLQPYKLVHDVDSEHIGV